VYQKEGRAEMAKELDPRIRIWADKIYQSNPEKFRDLIRWIKAAERSYDKIVIAHALELFLPYVTRENWWPYLDTILEKEEGKFNARNAEARSAEHKTEVGDLAESLLAGIRRRAEGD
jgi:hypothetical protein